MALSLTTQRDAEGAFTLPPDYGSYGKHLKALSRYFNKGSNSNSRTGNGNGSAKADPSVVSSVILSVALIAAVAKRDAISAEALLSVGANASCVDENLRTPAHYASRGGDVAMLAMLFDHGKDFYYALLHLK
jgi:ankyrin repeat protein